MLAKLPRIGRTAGESVRTTIAGVVAAEFASGCEMYGLTAGHAIATLTQQTWSECSSDSGGTDGEEVDEGEETEEDDSTEDDEQDAYSGHRYGKDKWSSTAVDHFGHVLGHILTFSTLVEKGGREALDENVGTSQDAGQGITDPIRGKLAASNLLDWALFVLDDKFLAQPSA